MLQVRDEDEDAEAEADSDVDEKARFFLGVLGILEVGPALPLLLPLLLEMSTLPPEFAFEFALLTESAPLARLLRWEKE